ncbi:hypothetical protein JNW88_00055 [Micromonospora sp. ATA32]|nr:hypothetical protein [Micromonospora sp. ATA32]
MLRLRGLGEVYDAVIAGCADLVKAADALDAELWLAVNVCAIRAKASDDDAFSRAMLDLIDKAERDGRPQCLVLLRAMAAVGPLGSAEQAHQAALRLIDRPDTSADAVVLPGWLDDLGVTAVVGDCAMWTEVFGEFTQVYCEYVHTVGGRRHGLLFTIDPAFRGVLKKIDVVVTPGEIDRVAPDMARDARRDGGRFERIPPADAAGLLRAAFLASADVSLPPLRTAARDEDALYALLPLAVRRVMTMPDGGSAVPTGVHVAEAWPPQRRHALAEEFLKAHPDEWGDPDLARMFVARIIDASVDVLGTRPDRIGPAVVARLFGEVLPATLITPPALLEQAQQVAYAWVRWLADSRDLPRAARRQVRKATAAVLTAFPVLCGDRLFNPLAPYIADVSGAHADGPTLQEIVSRRAFAVPLPGHRGDGMIELPEPANGLPPGRTHVDGLDAADPSHRDVITAIEQSAHGTDTRRMPAYAAVVEQLWHDQPPAAWQTVRRLQAARLPRQQIIDRLARAWQRYGSDASAGPIPGSVTDPGFTESYIGELDALGVATQRRR